VCATKPYNNVKSNAKFSLGMPRWHAMGNELVTRIPQTPRQRAASGQLRVLVALFPAKENPTAPFE